MRVPCISAGAVAYAVGVSDRSGNRPDLQARTDQNRVDFLRTDLDLCFTFANVAETEYGLGGREAGDRSLADAEKGYGTIQRFLSDPKHAKRLTDEEQRELTARLARLRARLDQLSNYGGN